MLSPRQALLLALLTLVWGLNWPVMKLGVSGFPPLSFRAVSMWLGLPLLYVVTRAMKVPLRIERRDWRELGLLATTNMVVWHALAIVSLQTLSSGRAAILGYTMPIFSAIWGALIFGQRLRPRQVAGVAAAAFGVALLLWHELAHDRRPAVGRRRDAGAQRSGRSARSRCATPGSRRRPRRWCSG